MSLQYIVIAPQQLTIAYNHTVHVCSQLKLLHATGACNITTVSGHNSSTLVET